MKTRHALLPALCVWSGCAPEAAPAGDASFTSERALDGAVASLSASGLLTVVRDDGVVAVRGAHAVAWVGELADRRVVSSDSGDTVVEDLAVDDALGEALGWRTTRVGAAGEPTLIWDVLTYASRGAVTVRLTARNDSDAPLVLGKLQPVALADGGGVWVGDDPTDARILENGSFTALDYFADLVPGDVGPSGWTALVPGQFEGHSASNWNHGIADVTGDGALVAGTLSVDVMSTVLNVAYDPYQAPKDDAGRPGFTMYAVDNALLPHPLPLAPGAALDSERTWIDAAHRDAAEGLERYADALALAMNITPWTRRNGGQDVPNGWNSWSASGGTGGYGTDINETIVLDNLAIMKRELRDWGMDWFQVDDGWAPQAGDWVWRADKFPHGPAWLTQQIRDAGFRPGLWMSAFTAEPGGTLQTAHPDWFAERIPLGQIIGNQYAILDLTHPEVQTFLHDTMTTLRQDWGFDWLKLDFGYYAMFGDKLHDPTRTREQAWRDAMGQVRDGLGPDAFLLAIGAMGVNYGIADGNRLTLDLMPVWNRKPDDLDDPLQQQGIKPTVRTAGRRWYLQDRVWMNHPDLIVFRSNTRDETWPRVTFTEARAFATFVGLSGGIVKLGDRLVDLTGDQIDVVRRLLPTYGRAARPVDVFQREFPELWHLPVDTTRDGFSEPYDLVGLFDWGTNTDLSTSPYTPLADPGVTRAHVVSLTGLGIDGPRDAFEFWTGAYLGRVEGSLSVDVPSHDARVVALRPASDDPHFLGWNRQITMGGTLLGDVTWDAAQSRISVPMHLAAPGDGAPFVVEVDLWVPTNLSVADLGSTGVTLSGLESTREGELLRVRFVPATTGDATLSVTVR